MKKERALFVINQSAILGLIQVLFLVVLLLSNKLFTKWDNISFFISLAFVYWSSTKYRDKFCDGFIRYGKAFNYGLKLMVLSGIIIGFFYFILLKTATGIAEEQIHTMLGALQEVGYPNNMIEEIESFMLKSYPLLMFFGNIFSAFFTGLIVSLLTSIFVKRIQNPFQEAMKDVE